MSMQAMDSRTIIFRLICLSIFLAPLNGFAFYAPLLPAILLALWRRWGRGIREWRAGPLGKWGAAFLGWSFLSALFSVDPVFSLFNWAFLPLMYASLYVLVLSYVRTKEERRILFRVFLTAAACTVLYGIFQFTHIQNMASDIAAQDWVDPERFPLLYRRMYSTLENPNLFAGYLLMMLGLTAGAALMEEKGRRKWETLLFSAVLTVCLLLTYSRGAWVSLAAMAAVLALLYDRRIWLVFLLVPVVLLIYHGQITERFLSLFSGEDTSTILRFALWESTAAMIEDFPLTGVGWGAYFRAYPDYNFFVGDTSVIIYHAHNMYLSLLAETGIPGGLFYFLLFFSHGALAVRLYRKGEEPDEKAAGLALALIIAGMAVYGIGDYVLFSRAVSITFWALLALAVCLEEERRDEKKRNQV